MTENRCLDGHGDKPKLQPSPSAPKPWLLSSLNVLHHTEVPESHTDLCGHSSSINIVYFNTINCHSEIQCILELKASSLPLSQVQLESGDLKACLLLLVPVFSCYPKTTHVPLERAERHKQWWGTCDTTNPLLQLTTERNLSLIP